MSRAAIGRERQRAKKELSNYLTLVESNKQYKESVKAPRVTETYRLHAAKLDPIDWTPYSTGMILSIGKCIPLHIAQQSIKSK